MILSQTRMESFTRKWIKLEVMFSKISKMQETPFSLIYRTKGKEKKQNKRFENIRETTRRE